MRLGVLLVRAAPLKRALAAAAEGAVAALLNRLRVAARAEHDRICETFSAMAAQLTKARRFLRVFAPPLPCCLPGCKTHGHTPPSVRLHRLCARCPCMAAGF